VKVSFTESSLFEGEGKDQKVSTTEALKEAELYVPESLDGACSKENAVFMHSLELAVTNAY
jgi:hypothetical protein